MIKIPMFLSTKRESRIQKNNSKSVEFHIHLRVAMVGGHGKGWNVTSCDEKLLSSTSIAFDVENLRYLEKKMESN
jgi:hypothetical protein